MTTGSTDGAERDALAGPGDDTRIMRSPDEDPSSQASGTAPADTADIESSDEATDKSFTTHMDDGDDFADA